MDLLAPVLQLYRLLLSLHMGLRVFPGTHNSGPKGTKALSEGGIGAKQGLPA